MLPLPPVRTANPSAPMRKAIRAVDRYTLWAFNPQHQLVRGYAVPAERREDQAA
jgi:hypothetical protein